MSIKEKIKKICTIDDATSDEVISDNNRTFYYALFLANGYHPMIHLCPGCYNDNYILEKKEIESELGGKNEYRK